MKVQWIELFPQKRKALHIILKEQENGIEGICRQLEISKATIFNKLNGQCKFKGHEYRRLLELLDIADEELEKCSKSYILKFL